MNSINRMKFGIEINGCRMGPFKSVIINEKNNIENIIQDNVILKNDFPTHK